MSEAVRESFAKLLPQGAAWEALRDDPAILAVADEFGRVQDALQILLGEILPDQTSALLPDWAQLLALPDDCTTDNADDLELRRQVLQKIATTGSLSARFLESMAAFFGYQIRVTNCVPFQAGKSRAKDHIFNDSVKFQFRSGAASGKRLRVPSWRHFFRAELPAVAGVRFRAGSRCATRLSVFENKLIECTLQKLKPAHSALILNFSEELT